MKADSYPHLTPSERSADARTLCRLLNDTRHRLSLWKQAAKEHRKLADGHADKLVTAMERLLALETEVAEECVQIAEGMLNSRRGAPYNLAIHDIAAAIRERFNIRES